MRGHHLVFEPSPEMFEALLLREALEVVQILNHHVVLRRPFQLQARHAVQGSARLSLVGLCVQKVVNLLIVELKVRARDDKLSLSLGFLS